MTKLPFARSLVAAACLTASFAAQASATIVIINRDGPGVGFNDPTPVAPVGGNPGTTLGQQRMNVYRYVADIWQQNIDSAVPIRVNAGWEVLTCDASSAVLGSASATTYFYGLSAPAYANTYYPKALTNKNEGEEVYPDLDDIKTQFNINLGNAGCLTGKTFYLGLDGNAGGNVNFVETLLHEIGHGLGFSLGTTSASSGNRPSGNRPSIWERFMVDNTTGKLWLNMTAAERKASATNNLKLAWTGPNAVAGASMLSAMPVVKVVSPVPNSAANYDFSPASFGATLSLPMNLGRMANVATQAGELGPACDPFNTANKAAVNGKVALIQRGGCTFAIKAKNAQDAGAIGVILYNNAAGIQAPGGSDPTVTIPVAGISLADGTSLKNLITAAVSYGTRSAPGTVTVALNSDPVRKAGADSSGRPLLYAPTTYASGSSVSHWDVSAFPNLLMEPNINPDLGIILTAPKDLTVPLLKDIGW